MDHDAEAMPEARTLGDLRATDWRPRTVKEELRANLLTRLASGATIFPGVVGYEDSVVPSIENAILAGHDLVFLGERGQAKTRMARQLIGLLDPWLPVVRGGELNDDPFAPVSPAAVAIVERDGDATPIDWLPRDRRYAEKLATPDITIADLIGEVDPIKVAEGRYLSDELTLHYGLIPRANRGIVAINELPDLAERIQVGLLNILEERDVQIRGFVVRLPLDLYVVASANPEDYTSRGRIITPLKDRLGSQIRTHYPRTLDHEMAIVRQEKHRFPSEDGAPVVVMPGFMEELVAELTHLARRSPEISQRSGVSVRVSVANAEVLEAAALKRAIRLGEPLGAPRVSDLGAVVASTVGKVELEIDRRRRARGADRRAAHHQGAAHDVQPARQPRRPGGRGRGLRGRLHRRDRRPDAVARVRGLDARGARPARVGPAARRVRRDRRRGGARGGRLGRRVPARGPAPGAPAQQGPGARRDGLPPVTAYTPDPRDLGPDPSRARPADGPGSAADALARAARYSAWDGSQHVADLEADEILDALADDVMAEGDLAEALRRLMDRGWRTGDPTRGDMAGLRDLMERLERRREEALERYGLDDVLGDIRRQLDEIVGEERAGVERRLDEASRTEADPKPDRRRPQPTRPCARCCVTSRPAGWTSSTACRPTSGSGSAGCRTTTSSSRTPASASTSWSSASRARSSTSSCRACPMPSSR